MSLFACKLLKQRTRYFGGLRLARSMSRDSSATLQSIVFCSTCSVCVYVNERVHIVDLHVVHNYYSGSLTDEADKKLDEQSDGLIPSYLTCCDLLSASRRIEEQLNCTSTCSELLVKKLFKEYVWQTACFICSVWWTTYVLSSKKCFILN